MGACQHDLPRWSGPNGPAPLHPKRWYDQRRSGSRAGMWQRRRPIEPQSRVETFKTHCHGHRGDADGSAGIRATVDHLAMADALAGK